MSVLSFFPDCSSFYFLLTLAVALTTVPPDLLRRDQLETCLENWQPIVANRLKGRALLWRGLTMHLLRSAHNEQSRYTTGYVAGLLKEKLGRWLNPPDATVWDTVAKAAVKADWYVLYAPPPARDFSEEMCG